MSKGTLKYNGKYFTIYEKEGKFYVYEKNYKSVSSVHKSMAVAKKKVDTMNKKVKNMAWWDR